MSDFKINISDVRLTPEELKRIENKIYDLESQIKDYEIFKNRTKKFFSKLCELTGANYEELVMHFQTDDDYDIIIHSSMSGPRINIKY